MTMPPRVILTTLVLLAATMLVGCSTNPATGEQTFMLQPWEWERSLAAEAGPQFTAEFGGETPDATAQAYVDEVGAKLTRAALEQAFAEGATEYTTKPVDVASFLAQLDGLLDRQDTRFS